MTHCEDQIENLEKQVTLHTTRFDNCVGIWFLVWINSSQRCTCFPVSQLGDPVTGLLLRLLKLGPVEVLLVAVGVGQTFTVVPAEASQHFEEPIVDG